MQVDAAQAKTWSDPMEDRENATRERLLQLVRQILGDDWPTSKPIMLDDRLSDLGMNSLKMVNLMLYVEAEFGIVIPQREITPSNFLSVATVETMIVKLTGT